MVEVFGDPFLNTLEEQVNVSNQNIAQAEAIFAGRAAVRGARSDFIPTVTTNPSFSRSRLTNLPVNLTSRWISPTRWTSGARPRM